ncbi:small RNA 2'-O-methyltransferase-like isoform X1 [Olea europaea var. sylvestris]|uniref:small RNA 2'-O-methyltransferase-like isoform X1 n=1 Tax=Olea europaea var. sylvestris TaxID=158386 RepID=UPI000C1D38E8|nr:small RNA 2'-O-methyltransferase-like isoform X1 [Olea europaea var. sylvestris]
MGGGLMESGMVPTVPAKKSLLTPKAIIHQKFGDKACYKVEEVQEETKTGCLGLAIPQKGPCLYRCTLQLPELVVISDTFKKKKDAEQSAAEKALEKLCIHQKEYNPTVQEAWDDLGGRLFDLFATEFLSSHHPLSGHFRAALQREGRLCGSVPISVIATYDAKISTICKYINSEAESNFLIVLSLVLRAASKLDNLVTSVDEQLSLQRRNPLLPEIIHALVDRESRLSESLSIEVIRIPSSVEKTVEPLVLTISSNGYYVDVIAQELGVNEASKVFISGTIGKASSDMRLYYNAPECLLMDQLSEPHVNLASHDKGSLNARASYLSGQEVFGDAILAAVGYSWKSSDLFHEDVSLRTYYRLLVHMMPSGVYKLSREAILAAELPMAFTTRSNWKGSFPREILCTFCRVHRLSEPLFESSIDLSGSCKKSKVQSVKKDTNGAPVTSSCGKSTGTIGDFKCEIKIFSKRQELILQYKPKESYKKQTDAMQSSALKVLLWLNTFFENPDMTTETLSSSAEKLGIQFSPDIFSKKFMFCQSVHKFGSTRHQSSKPINYSCINQPNNIVSDKACSICGDNSEITPSNGSLACVSYSISLVTEGEFLKEHIESSEAFEFEIGSEAAISRLEAVVTQMSVGQSSFFNMELPPQEFILAAAGDSAATQSLLSSRRCILEYAVTLLQVTEPLEERMEQALFSPSLSKQRVEFAVQHIRESRAASLVDFGCGSGSLLDSLLDYSTSLEKIAGVDISGKGLARAAKTLHPKLNRNSSAEVPSNETRSVLLYKGSVTNFDSRLYGFDIGTCLEVIEHMEEEDASLFGEVVLKSFCPRILIVSTPNYEYNSILQKSTSSGQEDDPDEKNKPKFRNHDHKFEWTRAQFNHWASDLAERHNYDVEFSGVGGKADVEPGFASQIAIFRRRDSSLKNVELEHHYESIWEWSSDNM